MKSAFASSNTSPPWPKLHVLVVDDDGDARSHTESLFMKFGCKVTAVGTCEKALRLLKIDHDGIINSNNQESIPRVDLIIVDYFMVGVLGMTGYMMLPILKKSPMKEIPVMILAPQPGPRSHAQYYKCIQDGAAFFVQKPLSPTLVQKLMMKHEKGDWKNITAGGMGSNTMKLNNVVARAIADDPDAFDNNFHGEDMQQMKNQFNDLNQLEDQYTNFEDYLSPFLV